MVVTGLAVDNLTLRVLEAMEPQTRQTLETGSCAQVLEAALGLVEKSERAVSPVLVFCRGEHSCGWALHLSGPL